MKRILFVLVALYLLLTSCGAKDSTLGAGETTDEEKKVTSDTTAAELEFYKTDEEVFSIETSLCTLKFPTKWKDVVSTVITDDGSSCSVVFTANLDGLTLSLYTVNIADDAEGYCLGTLKTDAGNKNVYLVDQYDEYCETLSEDSKSSYLELCEDINVLISKLVYDSKMVLSD